MLLAHDDTRPLTDHPFCYARVLGVYHANIILTGPESRDYESRRLEFLWVQWFELEASGSWEQCSLDKGRFNPIDQTDAFGFIDPADVLRCCHLIPAFADGRQRLDGVAVSRVSRDADDWKSYYINRYVFMQTMATISLNIYGLFRFVDRDMLMRYHWGLGVGHTYSHSTTGSPQKTSFSPTLDSSDNSDEAATNACQFEPQTVEAERHVDEDDDSEDDDNGSLDGSTSPGSDDADKDIDVEQAAMYNWGSQDEDEDEYEF